MNPNKFSPSWSARRAFTIVELLIVITIMGILISLLIPAIESSREAAHSTQCMNNLRQLATAATGHLNSYGYFPSGGWGYRWVGDPDRGFGDRQPGGWIFSILPFIEEKALWSTGAGINFTTDPNTKKTALAGQVKIPIPILYCPTRRAPALYPYEPDRPPINLNMPDLQNGVVKTDYAINVGDTQPVEYAGPDSYSVVDSGKYEWPNDTIFTGISFQRSKITTPQVTDGLSHTYLIGEKYVDAAQYTSGLDKSDNDAATQGFDNDMCRVASADYPPKVDISGEPNTMSFGSAHTVGFHMAFCDCSVHMIDFGIDPDVHAHLANRADGQSISSTSIH